MIGRYAGQQHGKQQQKRRHAHHNAADQAGKALTLISGCFFHNSAPFQEKSLAARKRVAPFVPLIVFFVCLYDGLYQFMAHHIAMREPRDADIIHTL